MSPQLYVCACGQLIPQADRVNHQKRHEAERTRRRAIGEPWRQLYSSKEWSVVRALVLKRDGRKCRIQGCTSQHGKLDIHHTTPLHQLWDETWNPSPAAHWRAFTREATNPDILVTVCPSHNRQLDNNRRRTPQ